MNLSRNKRLEQTLLTLALLTLPLAGAGCSTNPATGQKQFNLLSQSQEVSLGSEAAPQFLKEYGGPIPSPGIRQYVSEVGLKLAKVSERPSLPWEFHAVDSAQINAFALPGGKVFITRGLLSKLDSEAQLAGVLGHEIGHVTAQHIGQQMSRAAVASGVVQVIGVAASVQDETWLQVLGVGAQAGGGLYLLKFGRDQETQSDELGVRYMTTLGYNPMAQIQVMRVLKEASGGGGGMEMLQTHPLPQTRIEHLRDHIRSKYPNFRDESQMAFRKQAYQDAVLTPLAKLPPPKHTGQ
ncbi:MAG: M48 family metalloprotease [Phycisphaeraceae bacterium]|nr:M48 family metalloprotease [Phycisphaeraceae bacterium]